MLKNEQTALHESSNRILHLLLPALSIGIAMIIFALLEDILELLLDIFAISLISDEIIQNIFILFMCQTLGVIIVLKILIPLFRIKKVKFQPISKSSAKTTFTLFLLTLTSTFLLGLFLTLFFTTLNLDPQSVLSEITITEVHISSVFNILLYLFSMTIGAALFEELVFRRLLIPIFEDREVTPFVAVVLSSIIFACAHLDTGSMRGNIAGTVIHITGVFILGMMLGMTYILTRNILFPVAIHAVSNLFGVLSTIFLLLQMEFLLVIQSLMVLIMVNIGIIIAINTIWKYFRGSESDWVLIIKNKSSFNMKRGLVVFLIISLTLVYTPVAIEVILDFLRINNLTRRILVIISLSSVLLSLLGFVNRKAILLKNII